MTAFMTRDFLLSGEIAKKLYHEHAAKMPIVDYHCHVSPKEIYEDLHFKNITQVWLSGDHYKWRMMRSDGIDEHFITGNATDKEKFLHFASALPKAIGNPMYHWCHLELKNYFGYEGVLGPDTDEEVWNLTAEKLAAPDMGVRGLIKKSNVAFIGTTDDPVDSLEWHQKLAKDDAMETVVAPSFRPDKALNIDKAGWKDYLETLSRVSGIKIGSLAKLKEALAMRMVYFDANGCKASDHGLDHMIWNPLPEDQADAILKKGLAGEEVSAAEAAALKTSLLLFCAKQYSSLGWVMQIHYNCLRNPNSRMFETLGPDTGFDCIGPENGSTALAAFLDRLDRENQLPRTILYSLDAGDNAFLDTLIGSFQGAGVHGKLQHGSAWWFNDNKQGMIDQLTSLANLSLLGNFVGMLTDSRSFLSYTRHEYFRRILCQLIGSWVESGEYPPDMAVLGRLVENISYHNAVQYFGISKEA